MGRCVLVSRGDGSKVLEGFVEVRVLWFLFFGGFFECFVIKCEDLGREGGYFWKFGVGYFWLEKYGVL